MKTCPKCNSENIRWNLTCHTYKSGNTWMACMPCDSAIEYYCTEDKCDWSFTHGLNKGNPMTEENEKSRPQWLIDKEMQVDKNGLSIPETGIKYYDDDDS